jgi:hypothetical protein
MGFEGQVISSEFEARMARHDLSRPGAFFANLPLGLLGLFHLAPPGRIPSALTQPSENLYFSLSDKAVQREANTSALMAFLES